MGKHDDDDKFTDAIIETIGVVGIIYCGVRGWNYNCLTRALVIALIIIAAIAIIILIKRHKAIKQKKGKSMFDNDWKLEFKQELDNLKDTTKRTEKSINKLSDSIDGLTDRIDEKSEFNAKDLDNYAQNFAQIRDKSESSLYPDVTEQKAARFIAKFSQLWNRHLPVKEQDVYIETENIRYYFAIRWNIRLDPKSKKPRKVWQTIVSNSKEVIASANSLSDLGIATAYAIASNGDSAAGCHIYSYAVGYWKN